MTTIYDVEREFGHLQWMKLRRAEQLRSLFKEYDIKKCLELGFYLGKSSAFISSILSEMGRGHLTTIDLLSAKNNHPNIEQLLNKLNLPKLVKIYYESKSYTWRLMKMIENNHPLFDFCYIDGGHTWDDTGFAFFLVDKLLKPGGWIVFDDINYNFANSIKSKEKTPDWMKKMTKEELETKQVRKVWELLVKKHPNYKNFKEDGDWGFAQKKLVILSSC